MLENWDIIAFWSRGNDELSIKKYDFYVAFFFSFCSILLYVYLYVLRHQTSCAPLSPLSHCPFSFLCFLYVCDLLIGFRAFLRTCPVSNFELLCAQLILCPPSLPHANVSKLFNDLHCCCCAIATATVQVPVVALSPYVQLVVFFVSVCIYYTQILCIIVSLLHDAI